ncbi:MAG: Mov34/MPN/PAD-1 family protein [Acidobacteria bacterium]|nr:Mov34/MPN/PAD-1 family protein [Acidobacteriota bacterium]
MWTWFKRLRREPEHTAATTFWVTTDVLNRTMEILRQSRDADGPHEGVAYWAGRRIGHECVITTCIAPATRTTYASFDTSAHTNARVVMYLTRAGLQLLGQVHSHPGRLVDHSDGDDERAIMPYHGFVSVVVPHFARRGMRPLSICGVHVFEGTRFRRLTDSEVEAEFRVIDQFADLRV